MNPAADHEEQLAALARLHDRFGRRDMEKSAARDDPAALAKDRADLATLADL